MFSSKTSKNAHTISTMLCLLGAILVASLTFALVSSVFLRPCAYADDLVVGVQSGASKPVPSKITSMTGGYKKLVVKWKKPSKEVDGYQLQVSTAPGFAKSKTTTFTFGRLTNSYKKRSISRSLKGVLPEAKTYYSRIRTYNNSKDSFDSSERKYSKWSGIADAGPTVSSRIRVFVPKISASDYMVNSYYGQDASEKPSAEIMNADRHYANTEYIKIRLQGKVSEVKSSNENVLKAKKDGKTIEVTFKNAGNATLTYKRYGKKYAVKYRIVNWANPVSSLKIGSYEYANAIGRIKGNHDVIIDGDEGFSGKVYVKPASGWRLVKIRSEAGYEGTISNGASINSSGKALPVFILNVKLKNTRTGAVESVRMQPISW